MGIFGTDGVRGIANSELTAELAFRLARAGGTVLIGEKTRGRGKVILARDPRISGGMLAASMMAGFCSLGYDVLWADVLPTGAVAYLTRRLEADLGVMITASHNPVEDNGIKFFGPDGFKLSDEKEKEIEILVEDIAIEDNLPRPDGPGVGQIVPLADAQDLYIDFLKKTVDEDLRGLEIVIDGANGAASQIAPRLWQELGAKVHTINTDPTGLNINVDSGSTKPTSLVEAVKKRGAELGIAHDGDADRLIAVDEMGQLLTGDHILAICGLDLLREGLLPNRKIVATAYSNLGLSQAFQKEGGQVLIADNGDRYVLAKMQEEGLLLGGEQSGHLIFLNYNTTGDGLLSSLQLARTMRKTGKKLSQLRTELTELPQKLLNVEVASKKGWEQDPKIAAAVSEAEEELGDQGRIFLRPSGTEPLFRILVEGPDAAQLERIAQQLAATIRSQLG